jgi:PilZ domain
VSLRPLDVSASPKVLEGWALNVGRGGVRVILEERIEPGKHFEVTIIGRPAGVDATSPQVGRVVWIQEEPDGVVAGIEFRSEDKP